MNESSAGPGWYIRFPDKESGPFTLEQLQKLARTGRLKPEHLISGDREQWVEAVGRSSLEFGADGQAADDTAVSVKCSCGQVFTVPRVYVGADRACPHCGRKSTVPEPPPKIVVAAAGQSVSSESAVSMPRTADSYFTIRPWHERLPLLFHVAVSGGLAVSVAETLIMWGMAVVLGRGLWTILFLLPSLLPIARSFVLYAVRNGAIWSWYAIQLLALLDIAASCYLVALTGFLFPAVIAIAIYALLVPVLYMADVRRYLS
jgi:hypothetical protein